MNELAVYCRWFEPFPLLSLFPLPRGEFELELDLEPLEFEATAWTSSVFVLFISINTSHTTTKDRMRPSERHRGQWYGQRYGKDGMKCISRYAFFLSLSPFLPMCPLYSISCWFTIGWY